MEHSVYVCSWSRSVRGYSLWLKLRPQVRVTAPTYAEAEEQFIEAIIASGGAMQPVMEFVPPLPVSVRDEKYSDPELYLVCGDERFETDAPRRPSNESADEREERCRWLDSFYTTPVCRTCKYTTGRRNKKQALLTHAGRYDGAFGGFGRDGGPRHQIFSERFLELLAPAERDRLSFQPTVRKRGRKFFELVGPEGPQYVGVASLEVSGWRCAACDYRVWGYWIEGMSINSFVARSDLSLPADGGVFTIGPYPGIKLAVTASRWSALVGRAGTRGIVSSLLGVVPDREVVRRPELPTR